jgi:hypothetical protein
MILEKLIMIIVFVKILWIILLVTHTYLEITDNLYKEKVLYVEEGVHSFNTLLIGILLVLLFNHLTTKRVCIEGHYKVSLYVFGILIALGELKRFFRHFMHNSIFDNKFLDEVT